MRACLWFCNLIPEMPVLLDAGALRVFPKKSKKVCRMRAEIYEGAWEVQFHFTSMASYDCWLLKHPTAQKSKLMC